jgi:hypothetical protein
MVMGAVLSGRKEVKIVRHADVNQMGRRKNTMLYTRWSLMQNCGYQPDKQNYADPLTAILNLRDSDETTYPRGHVHDFNVQELLATKHRTVCHSSIILHRCFICTLRFHCYGD